MSSRTECRYLFLCFLLLDFLISILQMYDAEVRNANVRRLFQGYGAEKKRDFFCGRYIKKKGIYPRHPIFINLKSNTMKNTVQRYGVYPIPPNISMKISCLLTIFKYILCFSFNIEYQSFQVFPFGVVYVYGMICWLGQLMQDADIPPR